MARTGHSFLQSPVNLNPPVELVYDIPGRLAQVHAIWSRVVQARTSVEVDEGPEVLCGLDCDRVWDGSQNRRSHNGLGGSWHGHNVADDYPVSFYGLMIRG